MICDFPVSYFVNILEQGEAEKLAYRIADSDAILMGFVELIASEKLSVRLGGLVCMEYIKDIKPIIFDLILEKTWRNMYSLPEVVKGDFLYLVSLSENYEIWTKRLNVLLNKEKKAQLKEIIDESLENLLIEK